MGPSHFFGDEISGQWGRALLLVFRKEHLDDHDSRGGEVSVRLPASEFCRPSLAPAPRAQPGVGPGCPLLWPRRPCLGPALTALVPCLREQVVSIYIFIEV